MENTVLNEELETTEPVVKKGPTKSELTAKVADLEHSLNVANSQVKAAEKAIEDRDKYIDELYENSNKLTNKLEILNVQIKSIKNLSKLTRNMLDLLDERITAVENFLKN